MPDALDPERNRLSGRVRRFAQVGVGLAGAGASYGANRLFSGDDADVRNARALKMALGQLKGPLMKVAQMFATVPDLLPPELAAEFAELQSNAPSMGRPFVRRRMVPTGRRGIGASSWTPRPPPRWARSTAPPRSTAARSQ